MTMANAQRTIEEAHPGRFLLGLGVSHRQLVQDLRNHEYSRPVSYMREYLARMSEAPFLAHGPQDLPELVLAALGPRMLRLAAVAAAGAHPCSPTAPTPPPTGGEQWRPPCWTETTDTRQPP